MWHGHATSMYVAQPCHQECMHMHAGSDVIQLAVVHGYAARCPVLWTEVTRLAGRVAGKTGALNQFYQIGLGAISRPSRYFQRARFFPAVLRIARDFPPQCESV